MRMQKEEKIVLVLLLMALGSLAVAFWAFGPEKGDLESSSDSLSQKDASISMEGLVLEIKPTKSGGNLIIQLDSTPLPVFVPRDSGANEVQSRIDLGDKVRVKGYLWEFNGKKEIKLEDSGDLEKIDPIHSFKD
jgi:hypothetical protein